MELIPKRNATVQRTQSANDLNTAAAPSDTEQSEMDGDIAYNGTRIMTLRAVNPEVIFNTIVTVVEKNDNMKL